MISSESASSRSACPGDEVLAAFLHGRLPPDELEGVAAHLSACPACESSVEALHAGDTLLSHLRRAPQPLTPLEEPICDRLEDRVRLIPAQQTAAEATVSAADTATVPAGPPLPAVFGAYLLLEQLGQGGMGIVYKARQESLKRLVALKMVRAGVYASAEERMRFQREGEAIARLHHPHVVQIHEFGEYGGQLYFSMELLEGGTLASKLNGQPLPERETAELVRTLARAVEAAHRQGVVHRDLKPGNILLAADGTLKITDFGLAKVLDVEGGETCSDAILGTPAYMAPEQARGESRRIGAAADVYALGAILYETLTGRPPFRAESRYQTLELVRTREPEAPSRRRPGLSRELEAICLKCLEKEPSHRYASAAALADDLERWLKGEPTMARPPGWVIRLWWSARRRARLASAVALLMLLALALPAGLWYRDPERPRRVIEAELARGRSQALIGEMGVPTWFNWGMGKDTSTASTSASEPFSIHTSNLALLELVRNPQCNHFKFQAEVRHERSMEILGEVGLYVAHQRYDSQQGPVHYFVPLSFNGIKDEGKRPQALPANVRWMRTMNVVSLQPRLFWEETRWSEWEYRLSGPGLELFQATEALGARPSWRILTLQVTPEGVQGFWGETAIGRLSARELSSEVRQSLETRRQEHPEELRFVGFEPDFFPHGSLGLYVKRGSASFRRVAIEPLGLSD